MLLNAQNSLSKSIIFLGFGSLFSCLPAVFSIWEELVALGVDRIWFLRGFVTCATLFRCFHFRNLNLKARNNTPTVRPCENFWRFMALWFSKNSGQNLSGVAILGHLERFSPGQNGFKVGGPGKGHVKLFSAQLQSHLGQMKIRWVSCGQMFLTCPYTHT